MLNQIKRCLLRFITFYFEDELSSHLEETETVPGSDQQTLMWAFE